MLSSLSIKQNPFDSILPQLTEGIERKAVIVRNIFHEVLGRH